MGGEASRATVSTHVLDASAGIPASGVHVVLEGRAADGSWEIAGRAATDGDGRARFPEDVATGEYRLTFIDFATQQRILKRSGEYYAQVTRANALPE